MTLPYETIFSRTRGRINDPKELSLDENDLLETAAFLNRQRANGNITKAKALGEELALFNPEKF